MGQRPTSIMRTLCNANPEPRGGGFTPPLTPSGLDLSYRNLDSFWWRKKTTSWEWLLFSTLSMEMNLSSTCWGWMDHFLRGLLFLWDLQPFPFATDRLSFCLTAFSWGPSGSLGKVGNTMSFKSPTKAWHKNKHQGSYTVHHHPCGKLLCTVSMPTCFVSLHFLRWPKEFPTTLAEVGLF